MDNFTIREQTNDSNWFGFIASIFFSIVAVSLLTMLILLIPTQSEHSLHPEEGYYVTNFFYRVYWQYIQEEWNYYQTYHYLSGIEPSIGYYLLIPFALISLLLSGSTVLVKDFKKTRTLIFINWFLYLIPAITGIIMNSRVQIFFFNWAILKLLDGFLVEDLFLTLITGLYPIILGLPIGISLLLDKNCFLDWSAFQSKVSSNDPQFVFIKQRRINAGFFVLTYISTTLAFIFYIFDIYRAFLGGVYLFYVLANVVWWIIGDLISWRIAKSVTSKKLLLQDIRRGETDLEKLALRNHLSFLKTQQIIEKEILKNRLFCKISLDGKSLQVEELIAKPTYATPITPSMHSYHSTKSRTTALLLCIFLGDLGIHRFYVERTGSAILWFLTFGIFGIGTFVDFIMILTGTFKDHNGVPLTSWDDASSSRPVVSPQPHLPPPPPAPISSSPSVLEAPQQEAGIIFCFKCGAKNPANQQFCGNCGERLVSTTR